jgi:hypothetical protein
MAYSALGQGLLRLAALGGKTWGAARPIATKVVSKVGIPAAVGTVVGGVRGGQTGGAGGIIPGALGGGMTGGTLGLIPGVGGLNPYLQGGLGTVGGLYGPASMGVGGNVVGAGAQSMQRQGNLVPMSALPQGFRPDDNKMVQGPQGNWWYQMDPGGQAMGNRLGRQLDARTDASNINTLGNALYGQTERVARSEFERQAAATQLASNINQARQMALNSQEAGLRMGIDANQNMAQAMGNRSNFRYF